MFLKYDCTGLVREVDLRKQNSNVYMEIFVSVFTDMVSGFYALNSKIRKHGGSTMQTQRSQERIHKNPCLFVIEM